MLHLDISEISLQETDEKAGRTGYDMRQVPPRILMLQGPVGPFFKKLHTYLTQQDCDVWRICFNTGDCFFSSAQNKIFFDGSSEEWHQWLTALLSKRNFDIIILFGSERPIHKTARLLAKTFGIRVIALEEGYIRPGFITVEEGGNNSCSPIAQQIPEVVYSTFNSRKNVQDFEGSAYQGLYSAIYYALRGLHKQEHPELRHRNVTLMKEAFYWLCNGYKRFFRIDTDTRIIQNLLNAWQKKYYIVALQVASDCNLKDAALNWNTQRLITETIESFARSAPRDTRLVFKIHPRERGRNTYIKDISKLALKYEIERYVDVIDTGSMGLLSKHCAGMITINSTSGLSAIFHGVPLLVIGKSLYSNPSLATCAFGNPDFDTFWSSNWVAPKEVRHSYIAWIKRIALKRGDFYAPKGIPVACKTVSENIFKHTVLAPPSKQFIRKLTPVFQKNSE